MVWKGIHGIRDFTKIGCGIRDLTAPGKRDSPNLGKGCGIVINKENGMRVSTYVTEIGQRQRKCMKIFK